MQKLSSDAISRILDYMLEDNIKCLFMTGTKQIRALLSQTVTHTTSLDIIGSSLVSIKSLGRAYIDEETVLPKLLTHIDILVSDLPPADIVSIFPSSLTSVSLENWTEKSLALLPKTITHLKLAIDNEVFIPLLSYKIENIANVELQVPTRLASLIVRGVSSLTLKCDYHRQDVFVFCDEHLKILNSIACGLKVINNTESRNKPADIEHLTTGVYIPTRDESSGESIIQNCHTLCTETISILPTYIFPATLTNADLGVVNWFVPGILPATVTNLKCEVYDGKPDEMHKWFNYVVRYHHDSMVSVADDKMPFTIKFPPKLQKLVVKFIPSKPGIVSHRVNGRYSKVYADIDTLPTTLTYVDIEFDSRHKQITTSLLKIMHDITACKDIVDVRVSVPTAKSDTPTVDKYLCTTPKPYTVLHDMSNLDLRHLTKLIRLYAPVVLYLQNLPRSLYYLQCDELYNRKSVGTHKLVHVDVNFTPEELYTWMKKHYVDVIVHHPTRSRMNFLNTVKDLVYAADDQL